MNSCISNLVVAHSFNMSDGYYKSLFKIDDFSSNKICRLYLNGNGNFQPTVRINSFDKITTLSTLEDSIDNVVDIINDNGGFIVIGWYKRGEINNQINKDNFVGTEEVEYGYFGYYVVHMYPKNCNADEYSLSRLNISLLNE